MVGFFRKLDWYKNNPPGNLIKVKEHLISHGFKNGTVTASPQGEAVKGNKSVNLMAMPPQKRTNSKNNRTDVRFFTQKLLIF